MTGADLDFVYFFFNLGKQTVASCGRFFIQITQQFMLLHALSYLHSGHVRARVPGKG